MVGVERTARVRGFLLGCFHQSLSVRMPATDTTNRPRVSLTTCVAIRPQQQGQRQHADQALLSVEHADDVHAVVGLAQQQLDLADSLFDQAFLKYTNTAELISADTVSSGLFTELTYSIGLRRSNQVQEFIAELQKINGNNKVTLIAGYNSTDL